MANSKKPLTTGDIATYCGVSRMGVLRWIKDGRLKAHRTPGGHFRVAPFDFETFLAAINFPAPNIPPPSHTKRTLIITQDSMVLGNIVRLLSAMSTPMEIDVAMDEPTAIAKMAVFQPALVIFDGSNNQCNILDFVIRTKRTVVKGRALPTLLLAKAALISSEISLLAEIFSPIVLEPALPIELADSISARFKATIQRLLLD